MDDVSYWQKVGELLRGATEAAKQLEIARDNYRLAIEALNQVNLIQPPKEAGKPPLDRHTKQAASNPQDISMEVIRLTWESEKYRLAIEKLTTDVQKLQEPIGEIESIKRQMQALCYSQGLLLKNDPTPDSKGIKPPDTAAPSGHPAVSKLLEAFNTMSLPPVKYKIVNYLRAKKEVFYPSQIARELSLCSTYVNKVLQDLESQGLVRSIDTKGYRGRKLYRVTEPL